MNIMLKTQKKSDDTSKIDQINLKTLCVYIKTIAGHQNSVIETIRKRLPMCEIQQNLSGRNNLFMIYRCDCHKTEDIGKIIKEFKSIKSIIYVQSIES